MNKYYPIICNYPEIRNLRVVWWGSERLENVPVAHFQRRTGRQALEAPPSIIRSSDMRGAGF